MAQNQPVVESHGRTSMTSPHLPRIMKTTLLSPNPPKPTTPQLHHSPLSSSSFLNPQFLFLLPHTPSSTLRLASLASLITKASMTSSSASPSETEPPTKPFSVLFVCLGNICRSPAAEAVFTDIVHKRGLTSSFKIDSAGTINYHQGNQADPRMRAASKRRGIEVTSLSRPIKAADFRDFDVILAMDEQNRADILEAFNRWRFKEQLPEDAFKKVKLMCSYCKKHDETEVPDPYYGGAQGFEKVLDLLEDACESLLDSILAENKHILDS